MKRNPSASAAHLVGTTELKRLLKERQLLIEPLLDPDSQIDHTGIDLRLDCFFREFVRTQHPFITPARDSSETNETALREIEPFRDSFFLQPGEFALAQSLEYLALPNYLLGLLNGRSSLGRRGLVVHATANVVDPGWRGHLVFELANLGAMPIQLAPTMRIAKLIFLRTEPVEPYKGDYLGQLRITPPKADLLMAELKRRNLL
jgi:dCTP deaminase